MHYIARSVRIEHVCAVVGKVETWDVLVCADRRDVVRVVDGSIAVARVTLDRHIRLKQSHVHADVSGSHLEFARTCSMINLPG